MTLKYLSVCSGIEAATVAWNHLGWEPFAFSEIEKFPNAVLAHRYPNVENLGDMTEIDGKKLRRKKIDLVVGGTPCQAFSVAGLRQSLDDDRGNLTLKFMELCDDIKPRWIVWENVPGVLNTKDNAFGCFLGALSGEDEPLVPAGKKWTNAGFVSGPKRRIAWRTLDAQYFGLAQRRRRVFVVACPGDGGDPREVLFEREGVQRDTPPSREEGKAAPTIPSRSTAGGGLGTDFDCDGGLVTYALTGEGFDASKDGTGRGTPLVPVQCNGTNLGTGLPSLRKGDGGVTSGVPAVALRGRAGGATAELSDVPSALRASQGGGDKAHVMEGMTVRRLTPRECERLQGFPDDYTQIPWRGKTPENCPDGPRYKALGNSMAVPCMKWIGEGIDIVEEEADG